MKNLIIPHDWIKHTARFALAGGLGLLAGCSSPSSETKTTTTAATPPAPSRVVLRQDKPMDGVWLTNDFTFKGYDTLYITAPVFAAKERPNEVDIRAMAMRVLVEQLESCLRETKVFGNVTVRGDTVKPASRTLQLRNTVVEYERGGNIGRAMAGLFGGGQPVIKVRGEFFEGDKLMGVYELRRSGVSDEAKWLGAGKSDEEIQSHDIHVAATDLATFVKRTAQVP